MVDNADTCAGLKQMLTALAGSQAEGVRVLLLARSAGEWLDQLGLESHPVRYLVEAAKLTQLRLPVALAAGIPDFKITNQAVLSVTGNSASTKGPRPCTRPAPAAGRYWICTRPHSSPR